MTSSIPPSRPLGTVALASLFVVAVCLSIIAVDGFRTYHARDVELKQAQVSVENLARSLAQHTGDTLQQADAVLIGLVDRVRTDGSDAASLDRIHALLIRYAEAMPQFQRLSVIDAGGQWVATSLPNRSTAVNVADRAYFQHHRDDPSPAAFVGPVIRAKSSNQWIVTLSRRVDRPDGTFAGIVLASIDLAHFDRFFGQFDVGPHGALALATKSGMLLDRRPFLESAIGSDLSNTEIFREHIAQSKEGAFTSTSTLDGVERLAAFRQLDDFPLVVFAALSTDDILLGWKADATTHTLFVALLVAVVGLVGWFLVKQLRAKSIVEERLRMSQVALEANNEALSAMATKDGLTGLANRRELDRILGDEMSRAHRARTRLTVMMLDVDHFKNYNDRYGHMAGDDCLRSVAGALASCMRRPGDVVARFGGEEFVVVLPNIDGAGAATVADALCEAVRAAQIAHAGSPKGRVTISAGVAIWDAESMEVSTAAVLHAADAALYSAKRAGRDQVGWATAVATERMRAIPSPTAGARIRELEPTS